MVIFTAVESETSLSLGETIKTALFGGRLTFRLSVVDSGIMKFMLYD